MKISWATVALIIIMLMAFAYAVIIVPAEGLDAFYSQYGFSGANMLSRPYTLITSIFLHAGLAHLLSNIMTLLFFGSAIEGELGKTKMLAIFFIGAFVGDIFSLFIYPFDAIAVGASAGIFALIGAGIFVKPFDLSMYPYIIPIPLALLGIMYAIYNAYGFVAGPSNISYIAHFGGLVVGVIYGVRREGWKRSLLIVSLMVLILVAIPLVWNAIRSGLA